MSAARPVFVGRPLALGAAVAALLVASTVASAADAPALAHFHQTVAPLLKTYCYECHGEGTRKANFAFDEFTSRDDLLGKPDFWLKAPTAESAVRPPTCPRVLEWRAL